MRMLRSLFEANLRFWIGYFVCIDAQFFSFLLLFVLCSKRVECQ